LLITQPAESSPILEVCAGEMRCLMGKNGVEKSELVRILAGLGHPDRGEIRLGGEPCRLSGPHDSIARGIAMDIAAAIVRHAPFAKAAFIPFKLLTRNNGGKFLP